MPTKINEEIAKLRKELDDKEWASKKTNEGVKILYRELEEKNKKLKELDRLKTQFVANVSHEFRTPLAIIKECISMILEGLAGAVDSNQRKTLETAVKTVDRLLRLVTDLLDIARIESGKMAMKRDKINMALLLEEILATYDKELSKKRIVLKKDIVRDAGIVRADKDKISEVIINLLSNAIKYTPQAGSVTVKLANGKNKLRFEIQDTGPGIPAKYLDTIFDKFERITAEKEEGTGLGLAIARDIIVLHKGRLWAESRPGKGSKFIFTLPHKGGKR